MYIGDHARQRPDERAVALWPSGQELTWGELYAGATRLGNLFRSAGLREGDHVAIYAYNHLRYLRRRRPPCTPASTSRRSTPTRRPTRPTYIVNDCGADVLIVADSTVEVAQRLVERTPGRAAAAVARRHLRRLPVGRRGRRRPARRSPRRPSGAARSCSTARARPAGPRASSPRCPTPRPRPATSSAPAMAHLYGAGDDPVYLSPAPLHHAAPLRTSLSVLELGTPVVVMERFDAESALAAIEHYRVTPRSGCRRCSSACSSSTPRCATATTSPACGGRCTRPPPARSGPRSR